MLLLAGTAFFVAAEFAVVAADRTRLEHAASSGGRRAKVALGVIRRLSFHLSGAQLGITLCSLVLGVLAEPVLARALHSPVQAVVGTGAAAKVSIGLALASSTVASMVLGELIPKGLVLAKPLRAAENLAGPLRLFSVAVAPIIWVSNGVANAIVRSLGIEPREELASARAVEELELLIRSSGDEGMIDSEAVTLLTRSIRFAGKTAADALTPRVRVVALERDATVADLVAASTRTGFSRFPIYGGDLDDIVGLAHAKDVYRLPVDERASTSVGSLAAPIFAVPETRALEDLLADLRAQRQHMAVVVDEHGGTAGIVTVEDLVEEIVGEITDEYDAPPASVTAAGPGGTVTVAADLHPDEVADAIGLTVPDGPYETLAGFMLNELGHVPVEGEKVDHEGWELAIAEMDRHRIATVRVRPPADAAKGPDDGTRGTS